MEINWSDSMLSLQMQIIHVAVRRIRDQYLRVILITHIGERLMVFLDSRANLDIYVNCYRQITV